MTIKKKIRQKKILANQQGQASVEYILILTLMLVATTTLSKTMIDMLDTGILKVGGRLEKQLKTGRGQLSTWDN